MPYRTRRLNANILYLEPNQFLSLTLVSLTSIIILSSHLLVGLPKGLFPADLPVLILKMLLPSSTLATWCGNINLLDLITLIMLNERHKI